MSAHCSYTPSVHSSCSHHIFTPPDSSLEPKLETLESFSLISFILSKFLLVLQAELSRLPPLGVARELLQLLGCAAPHSACAASRTVRSDHGYPSRSLTLSIKLGKSA